MIWLLRHGDAEDGTPDAERPLTEKGREQARAVGAALKALGVELDACLTSPKVRAADTARIACDELGIEPQQVLEHDPKWLRELGLEIPPERLWSREGAGLLDAAVKAPPGIPVRATYDGRPGHPVVLGRAARACAVVRTCSTCSGVSCAITAARAPARPSPTTSRLASALPPRPRAGSTRKATF